MPRLTRFKNDVIVDLDRFVSLQIEEDSAMVYFDGCPEPYEFEREDLDELLAILKPKSAEARRKPDTPERHKARQARPGKDQ